MNTNHRSFRIARLTAAMLAASCAAACETVCREPGITATPAAPSATVADLRPAADKARAVIDLPRFERTPAEAKASTDSAIAEADRRLDLIASQHLPGATFDSTFAALDEAVYGVVTAANRLGVIKESSLDPAMRAACTEQVQRMSEWGVGVQYREDVYRACRAFADAHDAGKRPALTGEPLKLMRDTMRDYRRSGLALAPEVRSNVENLQKTLARLSTEFSTNITESQVPVLFSPEELQGVPGDFLASLKEENGKRVVLANVTPQYMTVMQNARPEETRRRLEAARFSIAVEKNARVLDQMLATRDAIASALGYASWADYQIEPRMAKTAARATSFLRDMREGLQPKFASEVAELTALKRADEGPQAELKIWDWRYYQNQQAKAKFDIDAEALRVYFPLERCLTGMFDIYQRIFGLRFTQLANPDPWAPGVTLYAVEDAASGEPMGLFYLDLFPREGKYNHFAQFDLIGARRLADGRTRRPVAALLCNFSAPTQGKPSLLTHQEVTTLFHEFGHAMHTILTRAGFARLAGTAVEQDFVEAPSQMLEHWVWDPDVLDSFAADYRDPSKKIPREVLQKMEAARLAGAGLYYRRQVALSLADLNLHAAPASPGQAKDGAAIFIAAFADIFLAPPPGTSMAAGWGHLAGYDAGYYGYAWAEAIAADMATAFKNSPDRFFSRDVGKRLRAEVYAVGGSRDADESVRKFLGRESSLKPFFERVGIK